MLFSQSVSSASINKVCAPFCSESSIARTMISILRVGTRAIRRWRCVALLEFSFYENPGRGSLSLLRDFNLFHEQFRISAENQKSQRTDSNDGLRRARRRIGRHVRGSGHRGAGGEVSP